MENYLKGKKSRMWNFFTPQNDITAKCNSCGQILSYRSSISNLKQHLHRKHSPVKSVKSVNTGKQNDRTGPLTSSNPDNITTDNIITDDISPSQPSTSSAILHQIKVEPTQIEEMDQTQPRTPEKISISQKSTLDEKLLQLVIKDFQPLSIVEDIGFQEYTNALNPSYFLPSRKTLSNTLLPAKYAEVCIKTQETMQNAMAVTITTDAWTSCNNDGFIAVTAHFIDEAFSIKSALLEVSSCAANDTSANIANELKRITSEWGVQNKILLALSDNADNVEKAITKELRWNHLGCLAHTINLIVGDALVVVDELIEKAVDIVSRFKRSTVARNTLDFHQRKNDKTPKQLIQAVRTRWSSVFYMLERIQELKEEIRASLAALGKEDWPMLSHRELEIVEELIRILAPLESTTQIMASEKHVTLSLVIIITNGLRDMYNNLQYTNQFTTESKDVIENIVNGINTHLSNFEENTQLLISTFLDPRFKHVGFAFDHTTNRARDLVTDVLTTVIDKKKPENLAGHHDTEVSQIHQDQKPSIWTAFDKKASTFVPSGNGANKSRAIMEIQRYLDEPLLDRTKNPLEWWKNHSCNLPNLSELVKLKFGAVATSVPCERAFSETGLLVSDRRNRLPSEKLNEILFININQNS